MKELVAHKSLKTTQSYGKVAVVDQHQEIKNLLKVPNLLFETEDREAIFLRLGKARKIYKYCSIKENWLQELKKSLGSYNQ